MGASVPYMALLLEKDKQVSEYNDIRRNLAEDKKDEPAKPQNAGLRDYTQRNQCRLYPSSLLL